MINIKNNISSYILCLVLGVTLGIIAKYLDTISVMDEIWYLKVLSYFGDLFTRLGIWVLIASFIAAYSKTLFRAAINIFLFFIGMLISYYIYSAFLFGVFPTRYFILWGSIALASPLLAIIVWKAKNNVRLSFILPALPMGLMLSLSFGISLFYIYVNNYIEELIMYVVLCVICYKGPKQMVIIVVLSFVVAVFAKQISPFHF